MKLCSFSDCSYKHYAKSYCRAFPTISALEARVKQLEHELDAQRAGAA